MQAISDSRITAEMFGQEISTHFFNKPEVYFTVLSQSRHINPLSPSDQHPINFK